MINEKICGWLINNADAPIRYRTAKELLRDNSFANAVLPELFENKTVQKWLENLAHEKLPPGTGAVWCYEHGCFDACLENALPKLVQMGLRGEMRPLDDAAAFYKSRAAGRNDMGLSVSMFSYAGFTDAFFMEKITERIFDLHRFVKKSIYDFYITEKERENLRKVPKNWKNADFIKPELRGEHYPFIYDLMGMAGVYGMLGPETDKKIEEILAYISTDEFHVNVRDGYGILIDENNTYHSQGWDPKYPGWFSVADYIEGGASVPKLLIYAEIVSKFKIALNTRWFTELLAYLERYATENDTYIFPKEWLKESPGYAVQGHHVSFGENRRKNNWCEIESTFHMQLLKQNI